MTVFLSNCNIDPFIYSVDERFSMFKNLLVCSLALLCSSLECGKDKRVKKQGAGLYQKRVKCSPEMTINDLKNTVARKLCVDPGQIAIVFGEQDILSKGETKLKDLDTIKNAIPCVLIRPGIRKPKVKKQVVKNKALGADAVAVKSDVQRDIDDFLNS